MADAAFRAALREAAAELVHRCEKQDSIMFEEEPVKSTSTRAGSLGTTVVQTPLQTESNSRTGGKQTATPGAWIMPLEHLSKMPLHLLRDSEQSAT